jgi:sec-independent protein translocase protein TatC
LRGSKTEKADKSDGRMTVVEHLTELRRRILLSMLAVVGAAALVYWFEPDIIKFFLQYYKDATNHSKNSETFIFTGPLDAFVTRLKVGTYGGIVLALPFWLWHLWRFITPGLNPKEKRYAIPFVASSVVLFAVGAAVAMVTLPEALNFLLKAGGQEVQPLLTADKYISLVSLMILAFGLAFEFPVVLVFLLLAHVISTQTLIKWRRWAIVLIFVFAAVITPSQDPYSLFFMAIPMYLFYEISILIGKAMKR